MKKILNILKNITLWIAVAFFALAALSYFPSFACLLSIIIAVLLAPIAPWQNWFHKYVKGKIKIPVIISLIILTFATAPGSDLPDNPSDIQDNTISSSTDMPTGSDSILPITPSPKPSPTENPLTPSVDKPADNPTDNPTNEPEILPTDKPTDEPPAHIHIFSAATCTAPKTCSDCGATEGSALGHTWKTATCTTPKTCSACGATEGAASHSWINASCTTPKTCSVCGATEGAARGHSWKNATCTTPKTCSACSATEGTAQGHSWKEATYTAPKTCTICNATEGNPLDVPGKQNYHGHVYTGGSSSKRYHYEAECAGKNSHEITWDDVERRGLTPCGTCVLK